MSPPLSFAKIPQEQIDTLLPPALLETLAQTHKVDARNQVRLPGKLVFLCLLHTLLHQPNLTQRLLEETYTQKTGRHADHSSFGARLAVIKPTYFEAIFAHLHQKLAPTATAGEARALHLRFVDATTVTLSAKLLSFGLLSGSHNQEKARRQVKSVLELSDGLPQLLHLCRDKSEHCDSVALGETMKHHTQPGDLWVFDKGCNSRQRLLDIHQAGGFFLTPHHQQGIATTRVLFTLEASSAPTQPPQIGAAPFVVTKAYAGVFANSQPTQNKRFAGLPLVIVEGLRFDKRSKSWKTLTLLSNLPLRGVEGEERAGPYTFAELGQVYARRWDIEVFFKCVKQHLNYSHLTSRCENGIRVMFYLSLIAAVLLLWYKQQTGIDRGWRSVKSWLAFDVQHWVDEALQQTFAALPEQRLPEQRLNE